MEKDLKISELASLWGASVPTTWNRIRKDGLTTFKKKDENNKEVTYVKVSDDILNNYVNNAINNNNSNVNNGYYEDMLNVNNDNNNVNDVVDAEYSLIKQNALEKLADTLINVNNDYNNRLSTVYEDYNKRLQDLQTELIDAKSKTLMLEDKERDIKAREGFYVNEITELKKENNRNKLYNKVLIIVITVLLLFITGFITYHIAENKSKELVEEVKQEQLQSVPEPIQQVQPPASQPKPVQKNISTPVRKH